MYSTVVIESSLLTNNILYNRLDAVANITCYVSLSYITCVWHYIEYFMLIAIEVLGALSKN
jgi:hypothetical protein